ncbi:hypothetical protein M885DRAFT_617934 [Pelagophyceae sp. CCMP2097]|nr:hypothetical protein M885DRAFT_617934 [Pelagophyceae sp. CCMP2097]
MGASACKPPRPDLLAEYTAHELQHIQESHSIWREVLQSPPRLTFAMFEEVFGHLVSDASDHFALFAGRPLGDSDKPKRPPSGPKPQKPDALRGMFRRAIMTVVKTNSEDPGAAPREATPSITDVAQLAMDTSPREETIEAAEVFAVLALVAETEIKEALDFVFEMYATRSGKQAEKAFANMLKQVSAACARTLGKRAPDDATLEAKTRDGLLAVAKHSGAAAAAAALTSGTFWDFCHDDVDVAQYLDAVFGLRATEMRISHRDASGLTEGAMSSLGVSALMADDDDDDDGDERRRLGGSFEADDGDESTRPSGIMAKTRIKLFQGTILQHAWGEWWGAAPSVRAASSLAGAMLQLVESRRYALAAVRKGGLVGVVSLRGCLAHLARELRRRRAEAKLGIGPECCAANPVYGSGAAPSAAAAAADAAKPPTAPAAVPEPPASAPKRKGGRNDIRDVTRAAAVKGGVALPRTPGRKGAGPAADAAADAREAPPGAPPRKDSAEHAEALRFLRDAVPAAAAAICGDAVLAGVGPKLPFLLGDAAPFALLDAFAAGHAYVPLVAAPSNRAADLICVLRPADVFRLLHCTPALVGAAWHSRLDALPALQRKSRSVARFSPLWQAVEVLGCDGVGAVTVIDDDDDGGFVGAVTNEVVHFALQLSLRCGPAAKAAPKAKAAPAGRAKRASDESEPPSRKGTNWKKAQAGVKKLVESDALGNAAALRQPEASQLHAGGAAEDEALLHAALVSLLLEPVAPLLQGLKLRAPHVMPVTIDSRATLGAAIIAAAMQDRFVERIHVLTVTCTGACVCTGVVTVADLARHVLETMHESAR